MILCSKDPLRDEGLIFAGRITQAGGQVMAPVYDCTHGIEVYKSKNDLSLKILIDYLRKELH